LKNFENKVDHGFSKPFFSSYEWLANSGFFEIPSLLLSATRATQHGGEKSAAHYYTDEEIKNKKLSTS
jgi:hypothetical protein